MGCIACIETEHFIKPGIKKIKELNPEEQGFSRAQSSAYPQSHQKMKSRRRKF